MDKRIKYLIIIVLSFILYGNTLFHDYTLDDAIVITENEYTLNGFDGLKDIFSEDVFNGFFEQKNKKLVAGGRYRPLSIATFAMEWEIFMGTPFDGLNKKKIEKELNVNANPDFILPFNKLLKDLSKTIHTDDRNLRNQQQDIILSKIENISEKEKHQITSNLKKMRKNRGRLLFLSHLVNLILYTLTCLIIYEVIKQIFKNDNPTKWFLSVPFISTLLFLVHPIHTEVIANIKGRDEILSLLGSLVAMLLIFKYIKNEQVLYIPIIFLSYLLALFSKEIAIIFIALIPLSIYFFTDFKSRKKQIIYVMLPLVLASAIYFFIRSRVLGGVNLEHSNELMNNSFLGMDIGEKYATIFYTLLIYLKLLIFPHPLTYDYYPYHIPVMNWTQIWPVLSVILYLFLIIYSLIGLRNKNKIVYGILFFLIALFPLSNLLFPIGVFMSERFIYAASIGIILAGTYMLINKIKHQKTLISVLLGILILFSIKTINRNRDWKNDFTLFTHDVKISSNSAKGNTTAGGKLLEEALKPGNETKNKEYLLKAIKYLDKAIDIYPKYTDALLLMGNAQWELYQSLDSAYIYYRKILDMNPLYTRVYDNIFKSKIVKCFEDPANAESNIKILHDLENYNPNNFEVNYYLGRIYGRYLNQLNKSINYFHKASLVDSQNISVYKDLGVAYGMSGKYNESAQAFKKAVELDPVDPVLVLNLAMTYANLNQITNALVLLDKIRMMDINKENANILLRAGAIYDSFGEKDKAQECFQRAKKLKS